MYISGMKIKKPRKKNHKVNWLSLEEILQDDLSLYLYAFLYFWYFLLRINDSFIIGKNNIAFINSYPQILMLSCINEQT